MKGPFSRNEERVKSFWKSEGSSEFSFGQWQRLIPEGNTRTKDQFIILYSRDTAKFNSTGTKFSTHFDSSFSVFVEVLTTPSRRLHTDAIYSVQPPIDIFWNGLKLQKLPAPSWAVHIPRIDNSTRKGGFTCHGLTASQRRERYSW